MVLGITSVIPLFVLIAPILGGTAIVVGLHHRNEARQLGQQPSAMGTAGWITGIVGTVGTVFLWLFAIIMVATGHG
jgi:hypothetical protein